MPARFLFSSDESVYLSISYTISAPRLAKAAGYLWWPRFSRRYLPRELPLHRIDLGEICRNGVIAAALARHDLEAMAHEDRGAACATKVDECGEILLLLRACRWGGRAGEDRREVLISLTSKGERVLQNLSLHHRAELRSAGPALVKALRRAMQGTLSTNGARTKTSSKTRRRS